MTAAAGALAIGLSLVSCAGAAEKTVDYTAESVTLAPGEALVVDFGEVNATVGQEWSITQEPDDAVLAPGEERSKYLGQPGETGAPSEFSYRFAPVGTGTTVIEFEYLFRGSVPEDPDDQKTAKIEVTVK
ncbi:protease inhibitor I42 family protein [Microbacterium sp. PMB16]|uniref:protease inhibitor I42 family protein n=1 Tax=Microbacterium sp. PMB16 TaxID=3120157 RepID=UPI003F4BF482